MGSTCCLSGGSWDFLQPGFIQKEREISMDLTGRRGDGKSEGDVSCGIQNEGPSRVVHGIVGPPSALRKERPEGIGYSSYLILGPGEAEK